MIRSTTTTAAACRRALLRTQTRSGIGSTTTRRLLSTSAAATAATTTTGGVLPTSERWRWNGSSGGGANEGCHTRVAAVALAAAVAATAASSSSPTSSSCSAPKPEAPAVSATKCSDIHSLYTVGEVIGEGGFGQVFRAIRKSDGLPMALKAISKEYTHRSDFQREIDAMRALNAPPADGHDHICRMYDVHDCEDAFYVSLELIEGGEVFEHLIENGAYSEAKAAMFLRQFAEALSFMHDQHIIHADLKPENLMLSSWDPDRAELKLVDFGCSVLVDRGVNATQPGTPAYEPPEMLLHGSPPSYAADVWAAGCILYIVLTGSHPFDPDGGATDEELEERIKSVYKNEARLKELVFDERTEELSHHVVSLLWYLLHPDPEKRTCANRFRRNRWVQGLTASWATLDGSDKKLEGFWQKEFRNKIMAKFGTSLALDNTITDESLKAAFQEIDEDGNGTLDHAELMKVLASMGYKEKDAGNICTAIDSDKSGEVTFEEFRAVLLNEVPEKNKEYYKRKFREFLLRDLRDVKKGNAKAESLQAAARRMFSAIDIDSNGTLDGHELRMLLRQVGVDEDEISMLIASVDDDNDGNLTFSDFKKILFGLSK